MDDLDYQTNVQDDAEGATESCMDKPDSMRAEEIRPATIDYGQLNKLSEHVLHGWPSLRAIIWKDLQPYWSFRDETAIIDGITIKCKRIIIPASFQGKVLNHLYLNHIGIEETRLLPCKSIYWINMSVAIEDTVNNCPVCLDFWATQIKDKTMSHHIPGRPSEAVRADMFIIMPYRLPQQFPSNYVDRLVQCR